MKTLLKSVPRLNLSFHFEDTQLAKEDLQTDFTKLLENVIVKIHMLVRVFSLASILKGEQLLYITSSYVIVRMRTFCRTHVLGKLH